MVSGCLLTNKTLLQLVGRPLASSSTLNKKGAGQGPKKGAEEGMRDPLKPLDVLLGKVVKRIP